GGTGNDTILGARKNTLLNGGGGSDTLQVGADFVSISDGQIVNIEQVLLTQALTLNLANQTEGFTIIGSAGSDSISSGGGAESIDGGAGADTISGGAGADSISGGA